MIITAIKSKALFVKKTHNHKFILEYDEYIIKDLKKGEVIIKAQYSSFNFKDRLLIEGNPGLVRKFPHIPGIDLAGEIFLSNDKRFKIGQKVFVVARPLGVKINGAFSEFVKVPASWVDHLPKNLSLEDSMCFGTSGFTSIIACDLIKKLLPKKEILPVLITGASGGVGIISTIILKNSGYDVILATSNLDIKKNNFFNKFNIKEVIDTSYMQKKSILPLNIKKFSAVIDSLGGNVLSNAMGFLDQNGILISVGNVLDQSFNASLMPLILRNVCIMGINAESLNNRKRKKIFNFMENFSLEKFNKKNFIKKIKFLNIISEKKSIFAKNKFGKIIIKFN